MTEPAEHPAVKFAHETSAGVVSIWLFESLHYFTVAPIAGILGVVVSVLAFYQAKRLAGLHK